jgi:hypothetical protein
MHTDTASGSRTQFATEGQISELKRDRDQLATQIGGHWQATQIINMLMPW